jgi:hypothetical protein
MSYNVFRYATAAVAKRRRLWRRPCCSEIQLRELGARAARSAAMRMYLLADAAPRPVWSRKPAYKGACSP